MSEAMKELGLSVVEVTEIANEDINVITAVSSYMDVKGKPILSKELLEIASKYVRMAKALETMLMEYRSDGCSNPQCQLCQRSKDAEHRARSILEELK